MTRAGYAVLIGLMALSLVGLLVCSIKQEKSGRRETPSTASRSPSLREGGMPEPVKWRTAGERFIDCRAIAVDELGLAQPLYQKKELAYILADQLLAAGAIAFTDEGGTLRASLRAVLPEGSGK